MSLGTFARRAALLAALTPASAFAQPIPTVSVPPPSPLPDPAPAPTPPPAAPAGADLSTAAPALGPSPSCQPPACGPRQRVIVVKIPAPEVVFRQVGYKAPPCGPCTQKPTGTAPPTGTPQQPVGAAPTGAIGTATVYQTYNVPYVTYNWVPAVQQPIGFSAGAATGGVGVAPTQLIGANTGAVGFGPFTAELEMMLARALLNRFLQPADRGQATDPCDAKIRALQQQITDLDRRIEALRKDTHDATILNTKAIVDLHKEVDQLFNAINKLDPNDSKEKIVGDLQEAVKKIQAARPK